MKDYPLGFPPIDFGPGYSEPNADTERLVRLVEAMELDLRRLFLEQYG